MPNSDNTVCLVDFHSHILPKVDDGSKSVKESVELLNIEKSHGVKEILLTPHFYPENDFPDKLIERRQKAFEEISKYLKNIDIKLRLGCEVAYFKGISEIEDLPKFKIQDSDAILIEMPFEKWDDKMIDEILTINDSGEYKIVLAHIERYRHYYKSGMIKYLIDCGVRMQANAGSFVGKSSRKKVLKMLGEGFIHLLGTDTHNLDIRPPQLEEASKIICDAYGSQVIDDINERAKRVLTR